MTLVDRIRADILNRGRLSTADQLEITDLYARYSWAVDTGDLEGMRSVFTEDAFLQTDRGDAFSGLSGITDFLNGMRNNPLFAGREHWVSQLMIRPTDSEDSATSRSLIMATHLYKAEVPWLTFLGHYEDELRRVDGVWYFSSRIFNFWAGDVLDRFPKPTVAEGETRGGLPPQF